MNDFNGEKRSFLVLNPPLGVERPCSTPAYAVNNTECLPSNYNVFQLIGPKVHYHDKRIYSWDGRQKIYIIVLNIGTETTEGLALVVADLRILSFKARGCFLDGVVWLKGAGVGSVPVFFRPSWPSL